MIVAFVVAWIAASLASVRLDARQAEPIREWETRATAPGARDEPPAARLAGSAWRA